MTRLLIPALVLALVAAGANAQDAPYSNPPPPPPGAYYGPPPGANSHLAWADVLRVDPVYGVTQTVTPGQQCYNQQVVQQSPDNKGIGTVLGAVIGGVLGSTIGHGNGRVAATVGGAVAGGAIGNNVASPGGSYATTQTTCQPVNNVTSQRQIVAYDVEYRYRGEVYQSRLGYDPGDRLRVRVSVSPSD